MQWYTKVAHQLEQIEDAVATSTIVGREAETFTLAEDADISDGVEQSLPNFLYWTLFISATAAAEMTVEISPDGINWYNMEVIIFTEAGHQAVPIDKISASAVKITSNNTEEVTAQIRGVF